MQKACSNALPTKTDLKRRKIITEDVCQLCSNNQSHPFMFFGIVIFRSVQDIVFSWVDRTKALTSFFDGLVGLIWDRPHLLELFAVTSQYLWSRRNKIRLEENVLPLVRAVTKAKIFLSLYRKFEGIPIKKAQPSMVKWKPPNQHGFKKFFDGGMFQDFGEVGLGVVIRNHEGELMAALSKKKKIPNPP